MEQTSPLPNPPINLPSSNKNVLIILLIIFVVVLTSLITYLLVKSQTPSQTPISSPTPLAQPTPAPDPTANWKTYSSNGLFFKYAPEAEVTQAERIKNEFNEGGTEINITYIRPGYNRQQTDISDGYVLNITWGEVIGIGTAKEVSQTRYSQFKDSNGFPELTIPSETKIANRIAYCMEMGPVFYSRTCYVDNGSTVFELSRTSSSNDIKQKQYYDLTLDQILSTFKFLD